MIRRRYIFEGRVQGVGFRATAFMLARRCHLTGWVMNIMNGDVVMEVQGIEEDMDRMIMELQHDRYIRINHIGIIEKEVDVNEIEFNFRFSRY